METTSESLSLMDRIALAPTQPAWDYGDEIDIARVKVDQTYKDALRWRAQTDLFWLATKVLQDDDGNPSYPDINERTHREVAEFFVQKDPSKPLEAQDALKQRLLLMPRGTFKTTMNIVDTIQWILCFPDLAILVMTAVNNEDSPLADVFVEEVAQHFFAKVSFNLATKPLHVLFTEHVIMKMPKRGGFTTRARQRYRREPTLMGASIEASLSGWHHDVHKYEDIQDNRNSQTAYMIAKVKKNMFINGKMLMSWGFRDMTGTRYGPMDVYGLVIERLNPKIGKVLWKPAMQVKAEAWRRRPDLLEKAQDYSHLFEELEEEDWELFFPEFLPWEKLMNDRDQDEGSFMTQLMNVATGSFTPIFPIEKLQMATLDGERMPLAGTVHIAWRLETETSEVVAGVCGVQHEGRMYIVDVERGKWTPTTQAIKIVKMAKRNSCHAISIEETPGARYLETAVRNEALRVRWELTITWLKFQRDDKERGLRIKSCEPILGGGRLFFSRELRGLKEMQRQLYLYGMIEETEIADAVSRVCEALPKMLGNAEAGTLEDQEMFQQLRERSQRDRVYNLGAYAPFEPVISAEEMEAQDSREWEAPGAPDGLGEMMPGLTG